MKRVLVIIVIFTLAYEPLPIFPQEAKDQNAGTVTTAGTATPQGAITTAQLTPGANPQTPMGGYGGGAPPTGMSGQGMVGQPPVPASTQPVVESAQGYAGPSLSEEEIEKGLQINQERISLDLKGIDINELFRILSLKMNVTIVPSKGVGGRVNIFLNNLTFDDALDVILLSQDLACDRKGSIITIMTSSEYERIYGKRYNDKRQFKSFRLNYAKPATVFNALSQIKSDIGKLIIDEASGTVLVIDTLDKLELMEETIKYLDRSLQTAVFDLKYAKPADVKTHLASAITTGPGEVFVDERSSKVVVSDLPDKIKKIERIVRAFDEASRQVFIDAEIVQITLRDEFQRGINWEKLFSEKSWDDLDFKGAFPGYYSTSPSQTLSDTQSLKTTVGILGKDNYNSVLRLLKTFGDAKVLSRPRIAAVNNQEAKILVGSKEPYVTSSVSQSSTTNVSSETVMYVDVGVKLNVVPTINPDGFITMKIKPEVSSVRETLVTALGSKIPIVDTSEAETVVKVKDGSMVMIAGLMKDEKRNDISGIPLLSKIPFIGAAFGSRTTINKKTELIVFLVPHIFTGETAAAGSEPQKNFPIEIVPPDTKRALIDQIVTKKLGEIKVTEPQKKTIAEERVKAKHMPKKDEATVDIQEKMKGVKDY